MTATLELPLQIEQAYLALAHARGIRLAEVVREALMAAQPPAAPPAVLGPEEWARKFEAWVNSHAGNAVVLPDEAMERESIYGDHGA